MGCHKGTFARERVVARRHVRSIAAGQGRDNKRLHVADIFNRVPEANEQSSSIVMNGWHRPILDREF
jgi:hypothetical protein